MSYNREVHVGEITAVNGDGTVDITINQRPYPYGSVSIPHKMTFQEHDTVLVGYHHGDRALPFILTRGGHKSSNQGVTPDATSTWSQWHMSYTMTRATAHKISGDTMASFAQYWTLTVTN